MVPPNTHPEVAMLLAVHQPSPGDMLLLGLACLGCAGLLHLLRLALEPHARDAAEKYAGAFVQWWRDRQEWQKVGQPKYTYELPRGYWHQWHVRGQRKGRR
jgi:hypothetical protein